MAVGFHTRLAHGAQRLSHRSRGRRGVQLGDRPFGPVTVVILTGEVAAAERPEVSAAAGVDAPEGDGAEGDIVDAQLRLGLRYFDALSAS